MSKHSRRSSLPKSTEANLVTQSFWLIESPYVRSFQISDSSQILTHQIIPQAPDLPIPSLTKGYIKSSGSCQSFVSYLKLPLLVMMLHDSSTCLGTFSTFLFCPDHGENDVNLVLGSLPRPLMTQLVTALYDPD